MGGEETIILAVLWLDRNSRMFVRFLLWFNKNGPFRFKKIIVHITLIKCKKLVTFFT